MLKVDPFENMIRMTLRSKVVASIASTSNVDDKRCQ